MAEYIHSCDNLQHCAAYACYMPCDRILLGLVHALFSIQGAKAEANHESEAGNEEFSTFKIGLLNIRYQLVSDSLIHNHSFLQHAFVS